eukprot:3852639-Pyramimonas_sp.AAC.4
METHYHGGDTTETPGGGGVEAAEPSGQSSAAVRSAHQWRNVSKFFAHAEIKARPRVGEGMGGA